MAKRDTYKYHLKRGNKIMRSGVTNDLDRREREHQREYGKGVHIIKLGMSQHEKVLGTGKKIKNVAPLSFQIRCHF